MTNLRGRAIDKMHSAWRWLLKATRESGPRRVVFRGFRLSPDGVGSRSIRLVVLKTLGAGLWFGASVVAARLLGPSEFGIYALVMSWVAILSVVAVMGVPSLLVRVLSASRTQGRFAELRGVLRFGILVSAAGLALTLLGSSLLVMGLGWSAPESLAAVVGVGAVVLTGAVALSFVWRVLQGFDRPVLGESLHRVLRPAAFLVALGGLWWGRHHLTALQALSCEAIALVFVSAVGVCFAVKTAKIDIRAGPAAAVQWRVWAGAAMVIGLVNICQVLNGYADMVMLGVLVSPSQVGLYRAAKQLLRIELLGLDAVLVALAPAVASAYAAKDLGSVEALSVWAGRIATVLCLPAAVIFLLYGGACLTLTYGSQYTQAAPALAILAIGNILNVLVGPVQLVAIMTGRERIAALWLAIGTCVNIVLNALLIPRWQIVGAAVASAGAVVVWNLATCISIERSLGVAMNISGRPLFNLPNLGHSGD